MKAKSVTLFLLFIGLLAQGQSYTLISTTILPYKNIHGGFRGLSGLEYVAGKGWYFVSDRGWESSKNSKVANAGSIFLIDAGFINQAGAVAVSQLRPDFPVRAPASLESIRYDPVNSTFFLASENDDSSKVVYTKTISNPLSVSTLLAVKNSVKNKGIEAIALTPSGLLWVAPEAGWEGETAIDKDTIHLYCYKNPTGINEKITFSYVIDRFPYAHFEADTHGGIADMLSLNDSTLLILERGYHVFLQEKEKKENRLENVLGRLYEVTIDFTNKLLTKKIAFDFNKASQFPYNLCNVEGISWGPSPPGKRRVYVVADDNFSDSATQQNQFIILEKN